MKKNLLSVTVVLMTAALFFAGCSNSANGPAQSLPGTWVSDVEYYTPGTYNGPCGTWTFDNKNVNYTSQTEPDYTGTSASDSLIVSDRQVYGVRAKVTTRSGAAAGIILPVDTDYSSYYTLLIWKDSYMLAERFNGTAKWLSESNGGSNTFHRAIRGEGQTNEVLIYTDGNFLIIKINGTQIKRISKKSDSFLAGTSALLSKEQTTFPVNANWEFLEFQIEK